MNSSVTTSLVRRELFSFPLRTRVPECLEFRESHTHLVSGSLPGIFNDPHGPKTLILVFVTNQCNW